MEKKLRMIKRKIIIVFFYSLYDYLYKKVMKFYKLLEKINKFNMVVIIILKL